MAANLRRFALLALVAALAGCGSQAGTTQPRQFLAFGTLVEVQLHQVGVKRGETAANELQGALQRWHRQWHPWEGEGLARVNRQLAAGREARVDGELRSQLEQALALARASGGRFDPTVGGLVRLWGFHGETAPETPPADRAIADYLADRPKLEDIRLGSTSISAKRPLQLDLGAFAKGVAVDRAIEQLRGAGIEHAIVNAGGDLRAIGRHGARPWRVGIRDPRGSGILAAVEPRDGEAVFTSGDYERYFEHQGRRYHHILDPRTGRPARGLRSVTVLADRGALADAAATALFVAGPADWAPTARSMGIDTAMVVRDDGAVELTAAMAERVRFVGQRPDSVSIVAIEDAPG